MDFDRLSESFNNAGHDDLAAAFNAAEPAEMYSGPIPTGRYMARAVSGELDESRRGTPCYCLRFEIVSGEYSGRRLVARWYLSTAALRYSRRDLAALGLARFEQLQRGEIPSGVLDVRVVLRHDDSGESFNEVKAVFPHKHEAVSEPMPTGVPVAESAPTAKPEPAMPVSADNLPPELVDAGLM